ncbi:MAG TPA: TolC family protein [Chthoniobacteraceae bacterium]
MNFASIYVSTLALLGAVSAGASPPPLSAQQIAAKRSGKSVRWERDEAARPRAHQMVVALLARPLTANSAAQIALLQNRSIQAAFEEVGISQADLLEAGRLTNPIIEGMARFPNRPADLAGSVAADVLELFLLPLRKRLAEAKLRQTSLRVADEALKLVAETKEAFYEAQAREQILDEMKLSREASDSALDLSQRQREAGNISELDLASQQAADTQSKLEYTLAEADLREKRDRLNRLMGVWGRDADWKASDKLPPLPAAALPAKGLEPLALEQRLDLQAAKADLESVVQSLGLTKKYRYLGSFDLGVSGERDSDGNIRTGPTFQFALPIFNQGQGKIARGEAQLRQAEDRLEALAADIRSEVRERRDHVAAMHDLAATYHDRLIPERDQILQLTLLHYNAMAVGAYGLIQARQNEIAAQRGYTEALRDYWIARAELERAVGGSFQTDSNNKH